jgi:hypothetical protein
MRFLKGKNTLEGGKVVQKAGEERVYEKEAFDGADLRGAGWLRVDG